ncbi:MAG: hypothetical protein KAG53_10400 [Endozoicomonadaceae bacterium]|nr:hypothetical protein [Endozoicomonadaceae bacterium]
MTIEYIENKHCFKLSFGDAYAYVKEHGGSTMEAFIAWIFRRTVTEVAVQAYMARTFGTTLGKQFGAVLSARTTKLTTEIPLNDEIKLNLLETDKNKLQHQHSSLSKITKDIKARNGEIESRISKLKNELNSNEVEFCRLEAAIKNAKVSNCELYTELGDILKEKQKFLTQLSTCIGDEFRQNNPGNRDLSDENRSDKLCDKLTEVYDNQWTDVMLDMEERQQSLAETSGVEINETENSKKNAIRLAEMLNEIQSEVKNYIANRKKEMKNNKISILQAILDDKDPNKYIVHNDLDLWENETQHIKKSLSENTSKLKEIVDSLTDTLINAKHSDIDSNYLKTYLRLLVRIIMFMELNDPPLIFCWATPGDTFDKSDFNKYMANGSTIDYPVWPAVYVDNVRIMKGVAQPNNETSES